MYTQLKQRGKALVEAEENGLPFIYPFQMGMQLHLLHENEVTEKKVLILIITYVAVAT